MHVARSRSKLHFHCGSPTMCSPTRYWGRDIVVRGGEDPLPAFIGSGAMLRYSCMSVCMHLSCVTRYAGNTPRTRRPEGHADLSHFGSSALHGLKLHPGACIPTCWTGGTRPPPHTRFWECRDSNPGPAYLDGQIVIYAHWRFDRVRLSRRGLYGGTDSPCEQATPDRA